MTRSTAVRRAFYASVAGAKKARETDEGLHSVVAWRETPFFTEEERAAFALT